MEAEKVTEKILADANAEAENINKQAGQKQADEKAKLDVQLADYKKQTRAIAQKAAKDEIAHILAAARMDIARQLLAEKRKLLDEVFERARRQLQNLPDDEFRKLITKLMLEAVETGGEEVIVDKNETRIDQQLIDKVSEQVASKAATVRQRMVIEKQDIGDCFILRRDKIKTNVTFDILLDNARKELEIGLAKELFGN